MSEYGRLCCGAQLRMSAGTCAMSRPGYTREQDAQLIDKLIRLVGGSTSESRAGVLTSRERK
jgi:hypothetical protein